MLSRKRIFAALVAILPQSAVAGGMGALEVETNPAAALSSDWTAFYVGGRIGHLESVPFGTATPFIGRLLFEGNGTLFGLHAAEVPRQDLDPTNSGASQASEATSTTLRASWKF